VKTVARRETAERLGYRLSMLLFGHTAAEGAQSLVFAASDPSVEGDSCYGPTGFGQTGGPPGTVRVARRARDTVVAERLWEASERLTGVRFDFSST